MEEIVLDQEKKQVLWKVETDQAHKNTLSWKMLENNEIEGLLPFDYFYLNSQIHFRYAYQPLQRMEEYFKGKAGDYETLYFICEGLLKIIERGREYLLEDTGYLLLPEWIFWNRYEKKLSVCYLPGREGNPAKDFSALVEYLLQHTEHKDKRAVTMIYSLYDMLASEGFLPESLLQYLHTTKEGVNVKEGMPEKAPSIPKKSSSGSEQNMQKMVSVPEEGQGEYVLELVETERMGKLCQKLFGGQKQEVFPVTSAETVVGRRTDSDLYLPFGVVSRRHALLFQEEEGLYIMDTASSNGTYLNGRKISAYVKTHCGHNDVITFADISYRIGQKKHMSGTF